MSDMKLVALDAGHGLKTAGKQTPDGIKEWILNDKVRDKIVAMLEGYNVEFIFPDKDEGNTDESLTSRRTMYVNGKVDAAVSLHHNGLHGTWNNATGVEIYTDRNYTDKDKKLAECIYANLPKYTGLKSRGIKVANFAVINQNNVPAVLVEGGFMDSKIDHPVITSDAGQTGYAKAVVEGLVKFLNLEKIAEKPTTTPSKPSPAPVPAMTIKKGDIVTIKVGATYYKGKEVPDWVIKKQWIVSDVDGDRVVINKSVDGKNSINSAIDGKYLTVVSSNKVEDNKEFKVRISIPNLNIRKGPGTNYSPIGRFTGVGVFTIVDVKTGSGSSAGWGLLKSYEKNRNGWISLDYAKRV